MGTIFLVSLFLMTAFVYESVDVSSSEKNIVCMVTLTMFFVVSRHCSFIYRFTTWLVTYTLYCILYVKVIYRHEGYIKTKPEGAVLIFPECKGYNQFMSRVTSVSGEFARGRGGKGCWSKRSSRRSFSCIGSDCG